MRKLMIPPVFVLISLALITGFYFILPNLNLIPFPINLAGVLICFWGLVWMGKSRDLFKKHQTTLAIEKSTSLVKDGVFSTTRNPMYIGMFLLLLGVGVCFGNVFSILVPFAFIVFIHFVFVLKEESLMQEVFDQEYLEYKKSVKRWV